MTYFEKYLRSWLEWAESNPGDSGPYSKRHGLCSNIYRFAIDPELIKEIYNELREAQAADFGVSDYPFGDSNYQIRAIDAIQHWDPDRLAWVKKTIVRLEEKRN